MNILDFEQTVNDLKGLAAISYFLYEGMGGTKEYLEDKAMCYLQDKLIELADEVEKLFHAALELQAKGGDDERTSV